MSEAIIRGGTILTLDPDWHIATGDVACRDGALVQVGGDYTPTERDYDVLDADGCLVLPGFIQSRVASAHVLARGRADQLDSQGWHALMWAFEAQADQDDVAAGARLAAAELLAGGTTTIVDVGAGAHCEVQLEVARDAGLRALVGTPMADRANAGPPPPPLGSTSELVATTASQHLRWSAEPSGRLGGLFAARDPRWCSDDLLATLAAEARAVGARIHIDFAATPAAQVGDGLTRLATIDLLRDDVILSGLPDDVATRDRLRGSHCHRVLSPTTDLALGRPPGSIAELLELGPSLSVGAGSASFGRLDAFRELHLAALLGRTAGNAPAATTRLVAASLVVGMATMGGARALGREDDLGSLEVGKRADLIVVDVSTARTTPAPNPYAAVIHNCGTSEIRHVLCDGRVVVRDQRLMTLEIDPADARRRARAVFDRIAG